MANSSLHDLPADRFTEATVRQMYQLADRAKTDEKFQKMVYDVVNRTMRGQWKNYRGEVEQLFAWVKKNVDYRRDPHDVELLQDAWATLDRRRGDCDDLSILLCSACEVLGNPCRFITVSTRPDAEPSHVYVETFVGGRWVPMDASMQWSTVGWAPQAGITNRTVWGRDKVGLSGYEEHPRVEGLGMHSSMPNGWTDDGYNTSPGGEWEGGFASRMFRVKPEGVRDDISNTFAPGIPGSQVDPGRVIQSEDVARFSDDARTYRSSDPTKQYPAEYPISSSPNPGSMDYRLPRAEVPMSFDPTVWNGAAPNWHTDPSAMNPDGLGEYVTDRQLDRQMLGELGQDYARLSPEERKATRDEYQRQLALARKAAIEEAKRQQAALAAKNAADDEARRQAALAARNAQHAAILARHAAPRWGHGTTHRHPNLIHGMDGWLDDLTAKAQELLAAGKAKTVEAAADMVASKLAPFAPPPPPPAPIRILPSASGPGLLLPGIAALALLFVMSKKGGRR